VDGERRLCEQGEKISGMTCLTEVVKRHVLSNVHVKDMSLSLGYKKTFTISVQPQSWGMARHNPRLETLSRMWNTS
jgi:hypothetical protein